MSVSAETLESMCELIVDCPHSTPKWTDEGILVLRNQNIKNGVLNLNSPSFTNEEDYQKRIKRAAPQAGDIVFTREAPMGEVCMIPEGLKCCLGQRQVLLRPKDSVCGEYLFWALQSPFVQHQISWNEGTGSTVSNVRIPVLKALNIPRYYGNEKCIAKVLSDIAAKTELNTQTNRTLEQIAQAIFKSWFVDFEPVKAKMAVLEAGGTAEQAELAAMSVISAKDETALKQLQAEQPEAYAELAQTAALFPAAIVDSELGDIPEGWSTIKIGNLLARLKPKKRYTKKQVEPYGQVPVFEQGSNIFLGFHNGEAGFFASPEEPIFIFGDHTCITHLSCSKFDISSNVIPLKGSIRPTIWTYYAILGKQTFQEYRRHWSEFIVKSTILPSVEVSERFSETATAIYLQIEALNDESRKLSLLRDTLLPKLLSGEITLPNTEEV